MRRSANNFLYYIVAWIVAGGLGWLLYLILTGVSSGGRSQQVFLGLAIVIPIAIGISASRLLSLRLPLSDDHHRLIMLGANWGVAAAAGWNVAVMVGGPTSGLATSLAAYRLFERQPWRQGVLLVLAVIAGRVAMELPGGTELAFGGLWCSIFIAIAASAAATVFSRSRISIMLPISILWWGGAWVLAYWLKNKLGVPGLANYGPNSLEVVIAFGLGGAMAGVPYFRPIRMLCWAIGGLVAALVGIAIDIMLTAMFIGSNAVLSGEAHYLNAGHVVGMGVGAISAMLLCRAKKNADA